MIRRPPRSTLSSSSAASDVYKRQGYFFAFFDIVTIAFALPVIAQQFHVSKTVVAYSVTSSLIGYIIGAYANSTIADKWGRKLGLMISVGLFSVGTLVAA